MNALKEQHTHELIHTLLPIQGVSPTSLYTQGVALGYKLIGLSARFLRVRGDDLDWLSVRFSHVWDDDLDWLSARCSCDNELAGPSAWLSIEDGKVFVP